MFDKNKDKDKEKGNLIFHTSDGLTPVVPVNKDASLGDILVMKEMLGKSNEYGIGTGDQRLRKIQ